MLLEYRDPHFWRKFQAQNWQPRIPTVIRNPFRSFPISEAMVLRALKAFQAGLGDGDERFRYMFTLGDSNRAAKRALRNLLAGGHESMDELEGDCARKVPGKTFGLMVNNFQSLDLGLWNGFTAFLQDAHPWIDFPIARCVVDLFFGNYASSFLGLHKDTQEIFGFVVRGEKTMLAWPFKYFTSRVEGITSAAKYFQVQLPVDYRKYRKDALVLKAYPGDIIYWPSDYWHIAEATPGKFSVMLSLGLFSSHVNPKRENDLIAFRQRLLTASERYSSHERSHLRSQDMTPVSRGPVGNSTITLGDWFRIRARLPGERERIGFFSSGP